MQQPDHYRERVSRQRGAMLFETTRRTAFGPGRSFLFHEPLEWLEVRELKEIPGLFSKIEKARAAGFWVAGYLSYECGYHWEPTAAPGFEPAGDGLPLAIFGVYRTPVQCHSLPTAAAVARGLESLSLSISPQAFAAKVEQIRRWIAAGDTYQVNLTDTIVAPYPASAAALFEHMMHAQPVEFGAMLHLGEQHIVSASPELFFQLRNRHITVRPMKGTSPRGRDAAEDIRLAVALAADEKNRAENVMIVDLLRSDLGRVAEPGSVRVVKLFAVEQFPSLLQMSSEIQATLRKDIDAYALFRSLFPSGSIVGAPKVRTMQLLRALEGRQRGVYTGAIGFFSPDDEAVFSVAIRTAVLRRGTLSMGVGAGITYDSDASSEFAECMLKAEFLRDRTFGPVDLGPVDFGLIETMRWSQGRCELLPLHLDRVAASAAHFQFDFDRAVVLRAIEAEASRLPSHGVWKLRVVVSRDGTCVFSPAEALQDQSGSLRAMLWPRPVASSDAMLQHKTTCRAVYDQAVRHARAHGYVDALFVNELGMVTEGAIHSIFVRHGSRWRTPPLHAGALPGVYRAFLLATAAEIDVEAFGREELLSADEVWLTNAVHGMRRASVAGL